MPPPPPPAVPAGLLSRLRLPLTILLAGLLLLATFLFTSPSAPGTGSGSTVWLERAVAIGTYGASLDESLEKNKHDADRRDPKCKSLAFAAHGSVSIIIDVDVASASSLHLTLGHIFHALNDSLQTEVIVALDNTVTEDTKNMLKRYTSLPGMRVVDVDKSGRGYAQNHAVSYASGDYLLFVQSGVWVGQGWMNELVLHLRADPASIVVPHLDNYMADSESSWTYRRLFGERHASFETRDWRLTMIPAYDARGLIRTPTLRGIAFAIRKDYFHYIGGFDEELLSDDSEALYLELSLRVWVCAGAVKIEPCAFVAAPDVDSTRHINKQSEIRIKRLWVTQPFERSKMTTDEQKYKDVVTAADTRRAKYDARLSCKLRFPVYNNVFVMQLEAVEEVDRLIAKPEKSGVIQLKNDTRCLTVDGSGVHLFLSTSCDADESRFAFSQGRLIFTPSKLCLSAPIHHSIKLDTCVLEERAQKWVIKDGVIRNEKYTKCLTDVKHPIWGINFPMIQPCGDFPDKPQKWVFTK